MSGIESVNRVGVLEVEDLVCHIEKTYWNGSGLIREMTFLWRIEEERVRPDAEGLLSGVVILTAGNVVMVVDIVFSLNLCLC